MQHHSSERDASQYTFANASVQIATRVSLSSERSSSTRQPALMTAVMCMATAGGEFLHKVYVDVKSDTVKVPSSVIDDPVVHLEMADRDLQMAFEERSAAGVLKQVGILLYYTMLLATSMNLHPYLCSTFLWIHEWQLGKMRTTPRPKRLRYAPRHQLEGCDWRFYHVCTRWTTPDVRCSLGRQGSLCADGSSGKTFGYDPASPPDALRMPAGSMGSRQGDGSSKDVFQPERVISHTIPVTDIYIYIYIWGPPYLKWRRPAMHVQDAGSLRRIHPSWALSWHIWSITALTIPVISWILLPSALVATAFSRVHPLRQIVASVPQRPDRRLDVV